MKNNLNHTDDVQMLRSDIINAMPNLAQHHEQWWLLGTSGCHLCEVAEQLLTRLQAVQNITYQDVDISEFDEPLMLRFATSIPVLLTKNQRLDYPFSVLDLQRLL
ncbi:MAG: glutaredoxin family protein [Psychrobacter sp.]|nr:glutaredoxin family protein [Psychrobacter sp.]